MFYRTLSVLLIFITLFKNISTDCPVINIPAGAIVISGCSTLTNSVCSIQCTSTGVIQSQICQANGLWSGTPFNCFGTGFGTGFGQGFGNFGQGFIGQATCTNLAIPVNGLYSGNCSPGIVGGTCVFQCRPGFVLRGTSLLSCLSTGSWSAAAPTCTPQTQTRWYVLIRRWFG
ncbi:P-selectin-like [Tetranychus urticae]|uniref:Sushi domain-containing protein n=1 Tax=Tetranychus urticae TaxID=32264 RepID=T1JYQ3_TETUR|nr:P-selectin-like [Tetranychus urticae]